MKWIAYIRYFFYLAVNWNLRVAFYIIRREIKGERKYGIRTTGSDELKKLRASGTDISHATMYMPASYDILEELFEKAGMEWTRHFIDIGCGKGRALCVAAQMGCRKVTGRDFSPSLCEDARRNLAHTHQTLPGLQYDVICKNALHFDIPPDADCFFLFNPFDEIIMKTVVKHIMKSCARHPRPVSVIYVNPLHREVFLKAGFREVYHCSKLKYLEGIILQR